MWRRPLTCLALVTAAGLQFSGALVAQDNYLFSDPNVGDLFRQARMAIGGAVSKVKTLQFLGRSKVDLNGSLIDCTVDIKILLPDHYLRADRTQTDAKLAGYAGKIVLSAIRSGTNVSTPPANLTSMILKNERARLARFLLGTATYVTPDVAMTFNSAGLTPGMVDPRVSAKTAATAEGRAQPNTADIAGPEGFRARLIVDATSKMPTKLLYPGNPQEETMTFEDRRDVNGFKFPFHITTSAGGRVIDELTFDQILVNPAITKADFTR